MKIIAISATPHKQIGASTALLEQVFNGIKKTDQSAECKTIFLADKKINYCRGCAVCLMKGSCPQKDDLEELVDEMKSSDGIIFSSPVYVMTVTAQMKTFLDRLLAYFHRPVLQDKYGLAISVSAGWGDEEVGAYLSGLLSALGVKSIGYVRAIAVGPGMFADQEQAFEHAQRMGENLAKAIKEKWQIPKSSKNYCFHLFLVDMVQKYPQLFKVDYEFWKEKGKIKD